MIKLTDLNVGDDLIAHGHDDLDDGQVVTVHQDDIGFFWVFSRSGHHYLDVDADESGVLKGFELKPKEPEDVQQTES